jgi:three-Cys-motif partner protein
VENLSGLDFIDEAPEHADELEALKQHFPASAERISVVHEEANACLARWCQETNWRTRRAVVWLDPYGMEVEWSTIEALVGLGGDITIASLPNRL